MAQKRAVVVGINDYPGSGADLQGCVNDALDWMAVLQERGYEVQALFNSTATRHAILSALTAAAMASKRGDRLVFTFSGHGTWVPDRNGDESDGRDEALVCFDYRDGGLLLDDTLHTVLDTPSGVRQVTIADACHSGTVSRFMGDATTDKTPRFLPPATFLSGPELARAERAQRSRVTSPSRPGGVLLSGCADHEISFDVSDGRPHGAFTKAAISSLPEARTYAGWMRAIRKQLPSFELPQTPQLTAVGAQRYWKPLR